MRDVVYSWALKALMRWRGRRSLVRRALGRRRYLQALPATNDSVRVAVVQCELCLIHHPADYADKMYGLVRRAVEGGAQLVVFPEDTGTHLLGLLPGARRLSPDVSLDDAVSTYGREGLRVVDLFRAVAPAARSVFETTFSTLAAGFGVHIVAGSILLPETDGRLYNIGYLYGPDGRLIGQQRKTHLFPLERKWGLACGLDVDVFETRVGRLAFPVCMDHTFFESARIAYLKGAEILIDPSANPAPYAYYEQMRGVWGRVQENPAYGVLACMVGKVAGFTFGGRSGIYAPLSLTPARDGVLAQASSPDREEIVFSDLDLRALRAFRAENRLDFNHTLYQAYLPGVYHRYQAWLGEKPE